jgi:ElaB/YqjD/DUF883 family membrane-anchored ribosome-binding protein
MVFALGLSDLQKAIDAKANEIQKEFVALSNELEDLSRSLLEFRGDELEKMREEQTALRERQAKLAKEVNDWRERARDVVRQRSEETLTAHLNELLPLTDGALKMAIERTLRMIDSPEEELARLALEEERALDQTPVDRLVERARTSYDLRGTDSSARQRAAVEFANRSGMVMDDQALSELEAAVDDTDPLVVELVTLTLIQLHKYRSLQLAELETAHQSVKELAKINHPAVIPALIEVLENPRTGFVTEGETSEKLDNTHSRIVALLKLVKWHTPDARMAIQMRRFDQNSQIVSAAERALDLFPGEWSGPLED